MGAVEAYGHSQIFFEKFQYLIIKKPGEKIVFTQQQKGKNLYLKQMTM